MAPMAVVVNPGLNRSAAAGDCTCTFINLLNIRIFKVLFHSALTSPFQVWADYFKVVNAIFWEDFPLDVVSNRGPITTTAIGAIDPQGAGGNWATVGRRSRGRIVRRQREKRKVKSVGLRIGTLNVGTMTGKGRELADMMERRKVDILCVQETRWKGSKAHSIEAGFKLFYYGVDSKRNGIGVVLKEEFVRNVLEVKRVSDRVMSLKLEIEGVMLNVVSGYAPQVGCELEEKEGFWSELDEVIESIPTGERVVIGTDFNGHVGEGNTGDEEVMGKFGVKERNLEGQMIVDFAKRMDMAVVNPYFQKREEHRVTYKSGDLEKAYDRVPRVELWYCMRKSGVAEKYVRVVQDMYERIRTVVRCAVGQTEQFNVEVGLHQGSALTHFMFAMMMDQLSEEVLGDINKRISSTLDVPWSTMKTMINKWRTWNRTVILLRTGLSSKIDKLER
ncbi:hypothetical protein QTP86_017110 [Hemibagrus guttatus]|nr:hypothetical protein QTP86_017110 [Hemibagrus guttatus]